MPRLGLTLRGEVQGVGLRPAVFRCATELALGGFVRNTESGVYLEVEGAPPAIDAFEAAVARGFDVPAQIHAFERSSLDERADRTFRIEASAVQASPALACAPDLAPCAACVAELEDPTSRRFGHAFIGCAACGPRFSILDALPYDRANTTMRGFSPCARCAAEFEDPLDRRFHAQPIACPDCGPSLRYVGEAGRDSPIDAAAALVARGGVLALRGVGGFQLVVDATNERAVERLRAGKHRPDKPFAVLFADLASVERVANPTDAERRLLSAPSAPIVLVPTRAGAEVAPSVARGSRLTGAMLPASALHLLLARAVSRPLVCTSGNRADEPLCVDDAEATSKLAGLFDGMLTHDRPIAQPLDDSVIRVARHGPLLLRRARGIAPRSVAFASDACVLALGGHQKAVAVVTSGGRAVPTPHVGDLGSADTRDRFESCVDELLRLLDARPAAVACDLHPDYGSTRVAERLVERLGARLVRVQHHHAHVASVVAEHGLSGPVLGFAWDGLGMGLDAKLWGGETLRVEGASAVRVASLEPFTVPAGERAMRDPALIAACALRSLGFDPVRAGRLPADAVARSRAAGALGRHTTSAGRLFDIVAALLGLVTNSSYEAQAAIALEQACAAHSDGAYPVELAVCDARVEVRLGPILGGVLADLEAGCDASSIASRFHDTLAEAIVRLALHADVAQIVLSGGCFQNARLFDRAFERLTEAGFAVYAARALPPNDGGLALGQAWVAAEVLRVSGDSG